jgi:hypothetical protein
MYYAVNWYYLTCANTQAEQSNPSDPRLCSMSYSPCHFTHVSRVGPHFSLYTIYLSCSRFWEDSSGNWLINPFLHAFLLRKPTSHIPQIKIQLLSFFSLVSWHTFSSSRHSWSVFLFNLWRSIPRMPTLLLLVWDRSCYVAWVSLKLVILLPQPPDCWVYRCAPHCPVLSLHPESSWNCES